ncbi:MAG TPA: DUF418 domain-containing protein [Steroidobacteraceae bacterium]|nr:DUF418 domain-containing protein [Steroidobacteraceae bacterium]
MPSAARPIAANERILTIDIVRGFALLGIFIMSMPRFNTSFFAGADGSHLWPAWWDRTAQTARDVLFSGKFNSLFSLLFAVGFTIQLGRLEERDSAHATRIYLKRLFWLFIFGAVHACVFWTGDILHVYAIFGLVLLLLRRAPDKLLWLLFAACILYTPIMGVVRVHLSTPADVQNFVTNSSLWEAWNNDFYAHGSFLQAASEHTREMIYIYSDPSNLRILAGFYLQIFSTMLLGLMLGRRKFFQNSAEHLPAVRRAQWWALVAGVASGIGFGVYEATVTNSKPTLFGVFASTCYVLCRLGIMIFYMATIIRCVHNDTWRRRIAPMGVVGRMPLSNYLLQTLIATAIFYGWGLGLWGKVGPALDLVFAFGIFFLIQMPLSHFWMKRHALGPMEYLWRRLTYGRAAMPGKALPSLETT